jgi:hypothetical protein
MTALHKLVLAWILLLTTAGVARYGFRTVFLIALAALISTLLGKVCVALFRMLRSR